MQDVVIAQENPRQDDVIALILTLDAFHEGLYPPEANHHLDLDTLCAPEIEFLVARRGQAIMGMGALWLRQGQDFGEVKRMFVSQEARGQGVGAKLLSAIEQIAREHGIYRLMLETGTLNEGALALYRSTGYRTRGPFAGYPDHPLSVFMEKTLS